MECIFSLFGELVSSINPCFLPDWTCVVTDETKIADSSQAKASGEDAKAAGDGDPTVQTGDRPGGLRSGEDENADQENSSESQNPSTRSAKKYPPRTPESNEAARTVRDTIEKGLKDKTLGPPKLWEKKHPTVGVTTYADHTVDVALSGGHGNVNASAAKLQALLPDNYRVVTIGDTGTIGSEFPGYQTSSNVSSATGEVWCAEPKLAAAAEEYQAPDATGKEATGQTIFWRGGTENGYPIPAADRAPSEEDLDLMNPCASCKKNEGAYMQDVVTGNDDLGSD
jgi:hypothetical protein